MPQLDDQLPEGEPTADALELTEEEARAQGIAIDAPMEWPDAYEIKYGDFGPDDDAFEHPLDPTGPDTVEAPPDDPALKTLLDAMKNVVKVNGTFRAELHPRDLNGRFTAKPFSAILGPGGDQASEHDRKTARAVGRDKGRRRHWNAQARAKQAQAQLDHYKDQEGAAAEIKRQYNQGILEGMAQRAEGAATPEPASQQREQRKLPQPKQRGVNNIGRYGAGYRDGWKAAAAVGEKRRRWMQRKAQEILATVPEDHPQRQYWQGVADFDPAKEAEKKKEEFKQLEVAARERLLRHARRNGKADYEAKPVGDLSQEVADVQAKAAAEQDDEKRAYYEGALEVLHARQAKELERKRADRMRIEWFKKGNLVGLADRDKEAANAYRMMETPREDVKAMWEGVLMGLGKPIARLNPGHKGQPPYRLGKALGELAHNDENNLVNIDLDAAKAHLAALEKKQPDPNQNPELLHWAGILDGMLAPPPPPTPSVNIEHAPGAPEFGDLPADNAKRALLHRLPGDEPYASEDIENIKNLGGGVNQTLVGYLASGEKVIIKPLKGERADMRHNVPNKSSLSRERAGWFVADQLGARAPRTVARDVPPYGPSTVMAFIPDAKTWIENKYGAAIKPDPEDVRKVNLLDAVIGNTDRHHGNAMVDIKGHVWAIDHGLSFPTDTGGFHRMDVVVPRVDAALRTDEIAALRKMDTDEMAMELSRIGLEDTAIAAMRTRVKAILDLGIIPDEGQLRNALRGIV